jgi:hypothetical protein
MLMAKKGVPESRSQGNRRSRGASPHWGRSKLPFRGRFKLRFTAVSQPAPGRSKSDSLFRL